MITFQPGWWRQPVIPFHDEYFFLSEFWSSPLFAMYHHLPKRAHFTFCFRFSLSHDWYTHIYLYIYPFESSSVELFLHLGFGTEEKWKTNWTGAVFAFDVYNLEYEPHTSHPHPHPCALTVVGIHSSAATAFPLILDGCYDFTEIYP